MTAREDVAVTLLMLLAMFIAVIFVARLVWLGLRVLVAAITRAADRRIDRLTVEALGRDLTLDEPYAAHADEAMAIVREDFYKWSRELREVS